MKNMNNEKDERRKTRFQRKISCKSFAHYYDMTTKHYRIRTNDEISRMYTDVDIVKEISQRLRWTGHVR